MSRKVRSLAVALASTTGLASAAFPVLARAGKAEACAPFEPLLAWQTKAFDRTTRGVQASQQERAEAAEASARLLFRRYLSGTSVTFDARGCGVSDEGFLEFEYARGPAFFREARRALEATGESSAARLLARVDARFGAGGVPPVRFVLEGRTADDPALPAGVARGSKALFASLEDVPASNWNIIFVHELAHLVDPVLDEAVVRWQDAALRAGVVADAEALADPRPGNVPPVEFSRIDTWLRAGLDRGFLAEYRAWVVTGEVYKGLRARGGQGALPWMDALTREAEPVAFALSRVFAALDPRFVDGPTTGLLGLPAVVRRLEQLREELRAQAPTALPPLGPLGDVLGSEPTD